MAFLPAAKFLLLFVSYGILQYACCAEESDDKAISNMKRVRDKIFKDYDKTVRPESHHNDTTTLYFDIVPNYIIALDEEKSLFSMDSWFVLSWRDKRLQWNASLFEGVDRLSIGIHEIWLPDIAVYNAHNSSINPMKSTATYLYSNGEIWWIPPTSVTSFCDVTTPVGRYPYDTHACNITVGSWSHHGWQINIDVNEHNKMYWDYFSNTNPRWEVNTEDTRMYKVVRKYECCDEPYIKVDTRIILKRRLPAQLQVAGVPSILVMMLTLTMFWIPSNSGKKIILGSSLLIILTILTMYCAVVTRSPRAQQLAVSFVQGTMIAVAAAVVLESGVIVLARLSGPRTPPEFLVNLLSGTVGTYMFVLAPWRHTTPGGKVRLYEDAGVSEDIEPTPKQEWLVVATGCDRILFVAYIVVFAAIHQA